MHSEPDTPHPVHSLNLSGLQASARRLLQTIEQLASCLTPDSPERFALSIRQVGDRSRQLVEQLESPTAPDLRDRVVRHDLRAHLALIIGYIELWQKRANQEVHAGQLTGPYARHTDGMAQIIEAARETLSQLDAIVAQLTAPETPPPDQQSGDPMLPTVATPTGGGPLLVTPPSGMFLQQMPTEQGEILVVDDNSSNRELLKAMLEQLGHIVTTVGGGKEALTLLESRSFDLILLDVLMPEMDGITTLDHLKRHPLWRHIPVLMISALDRLDSVISCIARGAEDYLTRPFNDLLLRARVSASLEKKHLRDREMDHLRCIDQLLHAIFPHEVVTELTEKGAVQPRRHEKVGVCFVDVVGFTRFCDRHANQPEHVVRMLEWYVDTFEQIANRHHVQKIKTIGDAFLMVSGLLRPSANPVLQLVKCAEDLLEATQCGPAGWQIRVGIHVGPVVAGTLGESQYSYDLWGSTVNIAARMESIGWANTITLSDNAWQDVEHLCRGRSRMAEVKGLVGPVTVWEFISFHQSASPPDKGGRFHPVSTTNTVSQDSGDGRD